MAAGKALPALHDHIWVTAAAPLQVHLTVWETAIEEVWPRPANYKFDDVGENSVEHQSQSHSQRGLLQISSLGLIQEGENQDYNQWGENCHTKHKRGGYVVSLHTMEFIQPHLLWLDLTVKRRKLLRHKEHEKQHNPDGDFRQETMKQPPLHFVSWSGLQSTANILTLLSYFLSLTARYFISSSSYQRVPLT